MIILIFFSIYYFSLSFCWEKHDYSKFENLTDEEFQEAYLGLKMFDLLELQSEFNNNEKEFLSDINQNLPINFDSREKWPNCIHSIRNQLFCGACWAFSSSSVLSDRFCIASNSTINYEFSPQYMVSCDKYNRGCHGGTLYETWDFLQYVGIRTDSCVPYISFLGEIYNCFLFKKCSDNTVPINYYAKYGSIRTYYSRNQIKNDIINNGPIQAGLIVFKDFKKYKSGIYVPETNEILGGHAIRIIGWGIENEIEYWIAANSWGEDWGEKGFLRIKMGECLIDYNCISGKADLDRI